MDGSKAFTDHIYSGIPTVDMGNVSGCVPCAAAMGNGFVPPPPGEPYTGTVRYAPNIHNRTMVLIGLGVAVAGAIWLATRGD